MTAAVQEKKEFLVFDIGKVVSLGDEQPALDLLKSFGVKPENAKEIFSNPEYYELLRGKISPQSFYDILVRKYFKHSLSYEQVVEVFRVGMFGIDREVVDILSRLPRQNIAFLTDIHPWHEEKLAELIDLSLYSDRIFMSYKIGLVKIDGGCFPYVISKLGVNPSEALLIDDSIEKVEMARNHGWKTLHYKNADQLSYYLTAAGWL